MKNLASNIKQGYDNLGQRMYLAGLMVVSMVLGGFPSLALATPSVGDVGNTVGDQSVGMTSGALRTFAFVGIVLVGIAFIKGRSAQKQGESIGTYVGMAIAGALLLSIAAIISIINVSTIGTDASAGLQGQIIQ